MKKLAVVNTNSLKSYPTLTDQLNNIFEKVDFLSIKENISREDLLKTLGDYNYIVTGPFPIYDKEFFEMSHNLKYIARFGIGYDNIDVKSANTNDILVSNIPAEVEKYDVAELASTLLMTLARKIKLSSQAVIDDEWFVNRKRFLGLRIHGKTVGIIGFGNIGKIFSKIMSEGFNCKIMVYDPYVEHKIIEEYGAINSNLDTLLEMSDFISLHCALTPESHNLLSDKEFSLIKNNGILINTARANLVDEAALLKKLQNSDNFYYGTDVGSIEPIPMNSPLLYEDNVLITPHIGASTFQCNEKMCETIVDDLINVTLGKLPKSVLK